MMSLHVLDTKLRTKVSVPMDTPMSMKPSGQKDFFVYYESIKRELNKRLKFDSRCDARLKAEAEGCTRLAYTMWKRRPREYMQERINFWEDAFCF